MDDDNLYKYEDFGFIGFDLWQVGLAKKHHQSQMWVPDFRGAISTVMAYGHLPVISGYKWDYTFYKWSYKYL